jgi:hypothetical protein
VKREAHDGKNVTAPDIFVCEIRDTRFHALSRRTVMNNAGWKPNVVGVWPMRDNDRVEILVCLMRSPV